MSKKNDYRIVRCKPVARFYYAGTHSHPVRRTVLVTESTPKFIRGYEVRAGSTVRDFPVVKCPIKTYARTKIAKIAQCGKRLRKRTPKHLHGQVTLERKSLFHLVKKGA